MVCAAGAYLILNSAFKTASMVGFRVKIAGGVPRAFGSSTVDPPAFEFKD